MEIASGGWDNVTGREPPNWRPWGQDGAKTVTSAMRVDWLLRAFRICLDNAGTEPKRWADILIKLPEFPAEQRNEVFERLTGISGDLRSQSRH